MGTGYFPGGKERPGRDADFSPPSTAVVKKGQSYTSTPPVGRTARTEPQCLYKGDLTLFYNNFFGFLTLEDETDRLSRNVGKELHLLRNNLT